MKIAIYFRELMSLIMTDVWIIIPILLTLVTLGVLLWRCGSYFYNSYPSQKMPQFLKLLASVMFFLWSTGYLLYYLAFRYDNSNTVELLFRAATSSVQMFFGGVDSNVSDNLHAAGHLVLAGHLALISFLAVGCTVAILSLLILSRFRVFIALWWLAIKSRTNQYYRLYVFFGINEESTLLAKDIIEKEKMSRKDDYYIIFVEKSLKSQDDEEKNGWDSIVNLFTHRKNTFKTVRKLNAFLAIMNGEFKVGNVESHDVFNALGLGNVKKIIENIKESDQSAIHLFLLNDNERREENVFAALELQQDVVLLDSAQRVPTSIHCVARYNSVNRSIEDMNTISGIDIKIIDPSHMSIELLKHDVEHHPINFVDIDTKNNFGTVMSKFASLVVGFGETGKDAVRFLYEFGAFVDSRSNDNQTFRSPFVCHVVDEQVDNLKNSFVNSSPAMFNGDNMGLIQFHSINYNSSEFYLNLLPNIISTINYIVLATGNDENNMTLAVRILKYAQRKGRDFKKLRIYVRSYESKLLPYMDKIAEHYNENEPRIIIFGKKEQLYKYANIVHNEFEEKGKRYYETYRSLRIDPDNDEGEWDNRRGVLTGSKEKNTFINIPIEKRLKPSITNLQKLRRKETQDKSNALHEETKAKILSFVVSTKIINDALDKGIKTNKITAETSLITIGNKVFPNFNDSDDMKSTHSIRDIKNNYDALEEFEQTLMDNLAKLEHIRWNASHEVMGYSFLPTKEYPNRGCDELLMLHNCLCPWEALDYETSQVGYIKDYKAFDYGVVETTIYEKMKEYSVNTINDPK